MVELLFVFLFQSAAGAPSVQQPPTQVEGVVTQGELTDPDQIVVCRRAQPIGSRLPRQRCTSRASDDAARAQAADLVRTLTRNSLTSVPQAGFNQAGSGKRGGN